MEKRLTREMSNSPRIEPPDERCQHDGLCSRHHTNTEVGLHAGSSLQSDLPSRRSRPLLRANQYRSCEATPTLLAKRVAHHHPADVVNGTKDGGGISEPSGQRPRTPSYSQSSQPPSPRPRLKSCSAIPQATQAIIVSENPLPNGIPARH